MNLPTSYSSPTVIVLIRDIKFEYRRNTVLGVFSYSYFYIDWWWTDIYGYLEMNQYYYS